MTAAFEPLRTRDLRRIHTGRRALNLEEDDYRALLERLTGKRSAADLNATERRKVIDEFYRLGFRPKNHRKPASSAANKARLINKIEALLADAHRPWAYVDGMARKMFGLDAISFCDDDQLRRIVAALVYDQKRRAKKIPPSPPLPKGGGEVGGI